MPINFPGVSSILGVPLILLSGRLACGYPAPWFPAWVAERSFSRTGLDRAFAWGLPHVERRSEEHTSELQSLMRISYAVFCLKKKTKQYKYVVAQQSYSQ